MCSFHSHHCLVKTKQRAKEGLALRPRCRATMTLNSRYLQCIDHIQWIPFEVQFRTDVLRNVLFDVAVDLRLAFHFVQRTQEILRIEFETLQQTGGSCRGEQQLANDCLQVLDRLRTFVLDIEQQSFEIIGHLVEVRRGDHVLMRLLETVLGQFHDLIVNEPCRAVRTVVELVHRLVRVDEVLQAFLHLNFGHGIAFLVDVSHCIDVLIGHVHHLARR